MTAKRLRVLLFINSLVLLVFIYKSAFSLWMVERPGPGIMIIQRGVLYDPWVWWKGRFYSNVIATGLLVLLEAGLIQQLWKNGGLTNNQKLALRYTLGLMLIILIIFVLFNVAAYFLARDMAEGFVKAGLQIERAIINRITE